MDLIEYCKQNKISLKELAQETGIIMPNIYKFSQKKTNPTIKTILLINDAIERISGERPQIAWFLPVHNSKDKMKAL